MEMSYARGGGGRSQLPSWVRGGLPYGSVTRGILRRDSETPQSEDSSRKKWKEEREKFEEKLLFLNKQHKETLQQLHLEAERLQKENRELSYRLVMCRCGQRSPCDTRSSEAVQMQKEIERLERSLAAERRRTSEILHNSHLQAIRRGIEQNIIKTENSTAMVQSECAQNTAVAQPARNDGDIIKFPPLKQPAAGLSKRQRKNLIQRISRNNLPPLQPFT